MQPTAYNDLSGGYKRYYRLQPNTYIQSPLIQRLMNQKRELFNIPENEIVLTQVQRTVFSPNEMQDEGESKCITGHGLHSDGADNAMLAILERENISGAENYFAYDLAGKKQSEIMKPTVYDAGVIFMWFDNDIYHNVKRARLADPTKYGYRTVLVSSYPGEMYMKGTNNPNNTLPVKLEDEDKKLRLNAAEFNNDTTQVNKTP